MSQVNRIRCAWAESTPDYRDYHDNEWGVVLRGDDALFERMSLEAFQSGLSWLTILRKRAGFRAAFSNFVIADVAAFDDSDVARVVSEAIVARRLIRLEYYKPNEDEFSERTVEPYALINGREGWYVASFDPARDDVRHFRLDRIKHAEVTDTAFEPRPEVDPAADVDGWPRTGEVEASRTARVWVSPERARWMREEHHAAQELADGSVVVELPYAGTDWLVRRVLEEAGDAAVLEPAEAREAVRRAVARLR